MLRPADEEQRSYLIEVSRLGIVVVIVGFVSRSHAGLEGRMFQISITIGHLRSVERISIVVWSTS